MTWTYAGDPSATSLAAVRFLIGDTNTLDQQLNDAEINFALSESGSNKYDAAIYCCDALAAKYSRDVNSQIESVREDATTRMNQYISLAARLKLRAESQATDGGIGIPYVGGVTESGIDLVRSDTDRKQPAFTDDRFNNPPGYDDNELLNSQ